MPNLKKGTLSGVFLYAHDNTTGTKWPPRDEGKHRKTEYNESKQKNTVIQRFKASAQGYVIIYIR